MKLLQARPTQELRLLKHRLVFGPILIVIFLGLIALDEWLASRLAPLGIVIFATCLLLVPLAASELVSVFRAKGVRIGVALAVFAGVCGVSAMYLSASFSPDNTMVLLVVPSAGFLVFAMGLVVASRGQRTQGVANVVSAALLLLVYPGLMLGFYLMIRAEHSAWWIVGIVMTTKMCDTGAYFTGRAIGRHKLIHWLSPGKTWEGLVGGVLVAAGVGVGFAGLSWLLPQGEDHLPLWVGGVTGMGLGLFGQAGDLAMSLLKRDAGIKDSSTLIPGLGGMMDVLDSPVFVAPVAWWMLALLA